MEQSKSKSKLDEEKAMVKKMVDSGMSFADVARQVGVDYTWVYKRCDNLYAKVDAKEKKKPPSALEKKQAILNDIRKERAKIKNEREKIDEEINCPQGRSDEELVEYRKRKDKKALEKIAGAMPEFEFDKDEDV